MPKAASARGDEALRRLHDYYASRSILGPRANALALRMARCLAGPRCCLLCCGHGIFENLLRALELAPELVSMVRPVSSTC